MSTATKEVWSWRYVYQDRMRKQDFDHDPTRDVLADLLAGATYEQLKKISEDSGVSVSTLRNWMNKTTRRPQHLTMAFVLKAMGKHFEIRDN